MRVSVVICTYSESMFAHLQDAVESVLSQTYDDVEVIVIVDGNDSLCDRVNAEYGDTTNLEIHCNAENLGLSASRNNALAYVTGDIVAFLDDDAIADEEWIAELVSVYVDRDAIAVGGKMTPLWVAEKPVFLPQEFYWLIGVTHRGFAASGDEVRNTFGSNISFRSEVLRELEGFDTEIGRQGEKNLQSEETLFCAQMRQAYGSGVIYNPDAKVAHKVFEYRTNKRWLLERAFWQGYSKRRMETILPVTSGDEESEFLRQLVLESCPARLKSLVVEPRIAKFAQLIAMFVLTSAVGFGYLYGWLKS